MRVLHLIPGEPFGGAQRLVVDLAAQQRRDGLDARILLLRDGRHTRQAAEIEAVPVQSIGTGAARLLKTRHAVARIDVAHLHVPPPWISAALPTKTPVVHHLHVRPSEQVHQPSLRRDINSFGERLALGRADQLIAISNWSEAAWRRAHPQVATPYNVVYNGIALPDFKKTVDLQKSRPFTIAMAGRLDGRRGIEEFIALAAAIYSLAPDIRFRIAGDGPKRAIYEETCRAAGLASVLRFEGHVLDVGRFWRHADLAAFTPPPQLEPFGLRLIEPIANGVPVIAYRTYSGADEVIDRCRGIAQAPYGQAASLAQLALELRREPALRARMCREGYTDIQKHFSIIKMSRSVSAIYEKLLDAY